MDLNSFIVILHQSWSIETAFEPEKWSAMNPARGHCVVSSLIVQDYFGGDKVRFAMLGDAIDEKHYANMLEGALVDTTVSQYAGLNVSMRLSQPELGSYLSIRERVLADELTYKRYKMLRDIVDDKVKAK